MAGRRAEPGIIGKPLAQTFDELGVAFHKNEPISLSHVVGDTLRNGPRAGANFENASPGG